MTNRDSLVGFPSQLLVDLTFRNNLLRNVGTNWDSCCAGQEMIGLVDPWAIRMNRFYFIHNTLDSGCSTCFMKITDFGGGSPDETGGADDALWLNNLAQDSGYGFTSYPYNQNATTNLLHFLPPGDSTTTSALNVATRITESGNWVGGGLQVTGKLVITGKLVK